jgi:hypothetical protein
MPKEAFGEVAMARSTAGDACFNASAGDCPSGRAQHGQMQRLDAGNALQRRRLAAIQAVQQVKIRFVLNPVFIEQLYIQFNLGGLPVKCQTKRQNFLPDNIAALDIARGACGEAMARHLAGLTHITGQQLSLDPNLCKSSVIRGQGRKLQQLRHRLDIARGGQTFDTHGDQRTAIVIGIPIFGRQRCGQQ